MGIQKNHQSNDEPFAPRFGKRSSSLSSPPPEAIKRKNSETRKTPDGPGIDGNGFIGFPKAGYGSGNRGIVNCFRIIWQNRFLDIMRLMNSGARKLFWCSGARIRHSPDQHAPHFLSASSLPMYWLFHEDLQNKSIIGDSGRPTKHMGWVWGGREPPPRKWWGQGGGRECAFPEQCKFI